MFEGVHALGVEVLHVGLTGNIGGAGQHVRRSVLIEACRGLAERNVSKGVSAKKDMC